MNDTHFINHIWEPNFFTSKVFKNFVFNYIYAICEYPTVSQLLKFAGNWEYGWMVQTAWGW